MQNIAQTITRGVTHREPTPSASRYPLRPVPTASATPAAAPAAARAAYLDLRVHLVNGKSVRFVQTDTAQATRMIEQVRPERAFSQPHLSIVDGTSTTTIPTSVIERMDFLTSPAPLWQPDIATIREAATTADAPRVHQYIQPDLRCQAELFSGRTIDLDLYLHDRETPLLPVDVSLFLTRLFSGKSVVGAREGGLFLLNPTNIMRVDTHSAEVTVAPESLQARQARRERVTAF